MLAIFNQFACQHPLVMIAALVGSLGIAFVMLVVFKEIFNLEFWHE